jgi:hypothetical protein
MTTYYKATRPDGTDFHTGTVDYAAALASGETITHPVGDITAGAESYLSVATAATDCTGMRWPCRLFAVEAVGDVKHPASLALPNKAACVAVRVVAELPAHEALGPQGEHIAALVTRARALTLDELNRLSAARDAAWDAARDAAWDAALGAALGAAWAAARAAARDAARAAAWDAARAAAWDAARDAAWDPAWAAAWDAALGLATRDLITTEQYCTLVGPWASVCGWPHPDDEQASA